MRSDQIGKGLGQFNQGKFFEAHEVLEDVWRESPEPEKKFWQGLVQVAVSFHHHSTGNRIGAKSVLARAIRNLSGYPRVYCAINCGLLLHSLEEWQKAVGEDRALFSSLSPPRIEFHDD